MEMKTTKKTETKTPSVVRPKKAEPITYDANAYVDLVYQYGALGQCSEPRLALQLLGQEWNYREDLRRAYNAERRIMRELYALLRTGDEAHHVLAYERSERRERLNARLRDVRARRGHLIDHGTYWLVEDAMVQSNKRTEGVDPIRKHDWDETGRIGAAIMSSERFLVMAEGPAETPRDSLITHKRVTLSAPNDRRLATVTIAVGEAKERRTISWTIKLARPLPPRSIVKRIAMTRDRNGHRFRWRMLVTLAVPVDLRPYNNDDGAKGVVGVDVGWRLEEGRSMRVATANDALGSFSLVTDTLDAFEYADAVRGIRDVVFEQATEYVASAGIPGGEHARLWRDKSRMRRLAERTQTLGANMWLRRDRHLEDIECGVRQRAIRRRLDNFRVFAARLAGQYRYVALEDMRMSSWVGEAETHRKERVRSAAALYLLQHCLAERFGPDRVLWIDPANTSRTCAACGLVRGETVGPNVHWTCAGCAATHHQDENAAEVIRRIGERLIDEGKAVTARTRKAATKKAKRPIDGVATGDTERMVITPREPSRNAAE